MSCNMAHIHLGMFGAQLWRTVEDRGKQIWWRCVHIDINPGSEPPLELVIISEEMSWFSPEEIFKINQQIYDMTNLGKKEGILTVQAYQQGHHSADAPCHLLLHWSCCSRQENSLSKLHERLSVDGLALKFLLQVVQQERAKAALLHPFPGSASVAIKSRNQLSELRIFHCHVYKMINSPFTEEITSVG